MSWDKTDVRVRAFEAAMQYCGIDGGRWVTASHDSKTAPPVSDDDLVRVAKRFETYFVLGE